MALTSHESCTAQTTQPFNYFYSLDKDTHLNLDYVTFAVSQLHMQRIVKEPAK